MKKMMLSFVFGIILIGMTGIVIAELAPDYLIYEENYDEVINMNKDCSYLNSSSGSFTYQKSICEDENFCLIEYNLPSCKNEELIQTIKNKSCTPCSYGCYDHGCYDSKIECEDLTNCRMNENEIFEVDEYLVFGIRSMRKSSSWYNFNINNNFQSIMQNIGEKQKLHKDSDTDYTYYITLTKISDDYIEFNLEKVAQEKTNTNNNQAQTQTQTQNTTTTNTTTSQTIRRELRTGIHTNEFGEELRIRKLTQNRLEFKFKNYSTETELKIEEEQENNRTKLKIILKNGRDATIKIMPDVASQKAIQILKLKNCNETNNCKIELKEVGQGNETRLAYEAKVKKQFKLFGLIKRNQEVLTQIDAETGEEILTKRPWWAFLASEKNELEKPNYNILCTEAGGEWIQDHSECATDNAGADMKSFCTKYSGEYLECESACRHNSNSEDCIDVCVQICSL